MKTELVVFDLAGTTVRDANEVATVLRNVMEENDVPVTLEEAVEVMGIPKPVAIRQLLLRNNTHPREVSLEWIDEIHREFVERMVYYYQTNPMVEEKVGASEVFSFLRSRGMKVIVDTGFDRTITNALIERLGWLGKGLIDGSVTSDEVMHGRPHPDMIFKAMELVNVTSTRAVAKVGDTVSDLGEGLNAGCRFVIGVTSGAHSYQQLKNHYHTHLIHNLEELIPILVTDELVSMSGW